MWKRCNNCPSILPWICQKKGIDAIMLGSSDFCRKVDALLHAWELLVSYLKATGEVTKELLDWIEIRTLGVVLQGEWTKTGSAARRHLHELSTRTLALLPPPDIRGAEETLNGAEGATSGNEIAPVTNPCIERFGTSEGDVVTKERVRAVLAALSGVITDPWPPLLVDILNGQRQTPDNAVLSYYNSELGLVLKTRIDQLIGSKCEDMALRLVEVFIKSLDDESWNLGERKWAVAHHYLDVYTALLHKFHHLDRITSLLKTLTADDGLSFIRRHLSKDTSSRPWKQSIKVASICAQMFMTLALVKPESINYPNFMEQLVPLWMTIYERHKKVLTSFSEDIRRILKHVKTSENIYELSKALMKQVGTAMRPFCIELNLRAFTLDVNVLLAARQRHDLIAPHDNEANSPHCNTKEIQALEKTAASHLEELAQLLHPSPVARRECLLSAFCLHPTSRRLASLLVEACDVDATGKGIPGDSQGSGSEQRGIPETSEGAGASNETTGADQKESQDGGGGEKRELHKEEMEKVKECDGKHLIPERPETSTSSSTEARGEERCSLRRPDKENPKSKDEEDVFLSTLDGLRDLTLSSRSSPITNHLRETEDVVVLSAMVPGDLLRQPRGLRDAAGVLGLEPSFCDDLVILISCIRVRSLSWALPWEELQTRCIAYLREGYYDRIACQPLRFLRPDFSSYHVAPGAKTEKEAAKRKKKASTQEETAPRDSDSSEERHVNVFEKVLTTEEEKRTRSLRAKRIATYFEEFDDFFSEKEGVEEEEEKDATSSQENRSKEAKSSEDVVETVAEECTVDTTAYPQRDTLQVQSDDVIPVHGEACDVAEISGDSLATSSIPIPCEAEVVVEQKPPKRGRRKSDAEGKFFGGRRSSVNDVDVCNDSPDSQMTVSADESQWYEMYGLQSSYNHQNSSEPVRGTNPTNVMILDLTSAINATKSKLLEMSSKSSTTTSETIQSPSILQSFESTQEHSQPIYDVPGTAESSQSQNMTVATLERSGREVTSLAPQMDCSPQNPTHNMKGTKIKFRSATGETNVLTVYLREENPLNPILCESMDGGATKPLVSNPGFVMDTLSNQRMASRQLVPSMPSCPKLENTQNTNRPSQRRMISPDLFYKLNPTSTSTCGKETTILENLLLHKDASLINDNSSLTPDAGVMNQSLQNQQESSRNEGCPSNDYHVPATTTVGNSNNWFTGNILSQVVNGNTGQLSDTFRYAVLGNETNSNSNRIPRPNGDDYLNPRDPRLFSKYKIPFKKNQGSTGALPNISAPSTETYQPKTLRAEEHKRCETITKYAAESIGGHSYCKSPTNFGETQSLEGKINILGNESMDQRCVSPEFKMWKYTNELGHGSRDQTTSVPARDTSTSAPLQYFQEFDPTSPLDFSTKSPAQLSLPDSHPLHKCKKQLKLVENHSRSYAVMQPLQSHPAREVPHTSLNQNYQLGLQWSSQVEESTMNVPLRKSKNQSQKKSKKNMSEARQVLSGEGTQLSLVSQQTAACGMLTPEGQNVVVKAKGKRGRKPKNATDPKVNGSASSDRSVKVYEPHGIVGKQTPRVPNIHLQFPHWSNSSGVGEFPNLIERCLALDKPLKLSTKSQKSTGSSGFVESQQEVFEKLQQVAIRIANPLEAARLTQCERAQTPFLGSERMICESSGPSILATVTKKASCRGRPRGSGVTRHRETVYTTEVEVEKRVETVSVRKPKTDRASETRGRKRRKEEDEDDSEEWTPRSEFSARAKKASRERKRSQTKAAPLKAIAAPLAEEGTSVVKEKKKRQRKRPTSDSLTLQEVEKQGESSTQETEKSPRRAPNGKALSPHSNRLPLSESASRKLRPSTRSKMDTSQV